MVKNFKKFLLWNQKADDLESWYAASGTQVLPSLFKERPWVDFDLFYGHVILVHYAFVWKKGKAMDISEHSWISKVKVIQWPSSEVTQIHHFQTSFP